MLSAPRVTRRACVPVIGAAACTLILAQPARTASPEGLVRHQGPVALLGGQSVPGKHRRFAMCRLPGPPDGDIALDLSELADLCIDLHQLLEYMLQEQDKCGGQLGYDADLRG
jgi:hypothetical protein